MNKGPVVSFAEPEANHRQRIKAMTPAEWLRLVVELSETARRLANARCITRAPSVSQ